MQTLHHNTADCEKSLFKVSIVEMIPGVNIIAAFVELLLLSRLSKVRENAEIHKHFKIDKLSNPQKDKNLSDALELLNTKVDIPFNEKQAVAQQLKGAYTGELQHKPASMLRQLLKSTLDQTKAKLDKDNEELVKLNADNVKGKPKMRKVLVDGIEEMDLWVGEPPEITKDREKKLIKLNADIENSKKLIGQLETAITKLST